MVQYNIAMTSAQACSITVVCVESNVASQLYIENPRFGNVVSTPYKNHQYRNQPN